MIKVYIDTNIFDYVVLRNEIYGKACKEILDDVGILLDAHCSFLVPIEILGSLSEINSQIAFKALPAFFAFKMNLIEINKDLLSIASKIMHKTKIDGYDAVHAAAMKKENIKIIITENYKDFKKIPKIKIIRPLEYTKWKK
jgi:predicted nucleic acid-binding protein